MPKRSKHISNLQQFLIENQIGQDVVAIKDAKRLYWNKQKALWRKEQRKHTKSVTAHFNIREYASLAAYAKRHSKSCTAYVKSVALAYGKEAYLQLAPNAVNILREAYLLNYHALRDLQEELMLPADIGGLVIQRMEVLNTTIQNELLNPKRLETAIRDVLIEQPEFKQHLFELLHTL